MHLDELQIISYTNKRPHRGKILSLHYSRTERFPVESFARKNDSPSLDRSVRTSGAVQMNGRKALNALRVVQDAIHRFQPRKTAAIVLSGKRCNPRTRSGSPGISSTTPTPVPRRPPLSLSQLIRRTQFTNALVDLMDPPQKPAVSLQLFKKRCSLFLLPPLLFLSLYKIPNINSHAY